MSAVRKRTLKAVAGALVAAALVVTPLVTAGASAEETAAIWPAETVGVKGGLVEWSPETNQTDYWEERYPDAVSCYSSEANTAHGKITDSGKTVTLNEYNPSWPGDHWEVLVIKAGNLWNSVIENPDPGVAYASPPNSAGKQANVSHWIVCKGETPEQPDDKITENKESSTDCGENVVVTVTTTTTTPYKWDPEADEWVLDEANATTEETSETRALTEEEWADCHPTTTKTTYGEWVDGEWECGDTSVTQTREVYTTVYHGEVAEPTVTTTETQTRELSAEESEEGCEPTPTPTPTPTATPVLPATPASTDPGALAATGGGISPMFAVAGGAVLFAGVSAVAFAAYRRRQGAAD